SLLQGDQLYIQDQGNSANFIRLDLTATPTNNTSWFLLPVALHNPTSYGGTLPSNTTPCTITFYYAGAGGGGGRTTITVPAADGTPSYTGTSTLQFDEADGFSLSLASTGVARVDWVCTFVTGTAGSDFAISHAGTVYTFNLPDAGITARGVVNTTAQSFSGTKYCRNSIGVCISHDVSG